MTSTGGVMGMVSHRLLSVVRQELRDSGRRDSILWGRRGSMGRLWLGLLGRPGGGTWRGNVTGCSLVSVSYNMSQVNIQNQFPVTFWCFFYYHI